MNEATQEPKLCYVKDAWAYFTTQPVEKQNGDDWNDAPWEHNAGPPYDDHETPKRWDIIKVAWHGDLETPGGWSGNSRWCVDQINAGAVAWLTSPSHKSGDELVVIHAGATLEDFKRLVAKAGGHVYERSK